MKTNKAAGLDSVITAEALQNVDAMVDIVHALCAEVYTSLMPPNQWTTSVTVPLPKKGDLSHMTNYPWNIPLINQCKCTTRSYSTESETMWILS